MGFVDKRRLKDADLYVVHETDHLGETLPIDHYRVEPGPYYVDFSSTGPSCDCGDFAWRDIEHCKHMIAALRHTGQLSADGRLR